MSKKYNTILFDLDGTLVDSSESIINTHQAVLTTLGYDSVDGRILKKAIGTGLENVYRNTLFLKEKDIPKAISQYRLLYEKDFIFQAKLYSSVKSTLEFLKNNNYKLGIATMKPEKFINPLLIYLDIHDYFDVAKGVSENDNETKSNLIDSCIEVLNVAPDTTLFVGDTFTDLNGAKESNVDFAAVLYGFGFDKKNDLIDAKYLINDFKEIENIR